MVNLLIPRMNTADPTAARLPHFPVAAFAIVMGLGGLTLAWRKAEDLLPLPLTLSPALLALTTVVFIVIAGLYAAKLLRHPEAVKKEWRHPVKLSFVPTLSIALILLAIAWLPQSAAYSKLLWIIGVSLHLILTLYILTRWLHGAEFQIVHMNPAWFIPVVGNILVPIAGVAHAPAEVAWFFYAIGILFWPVLLAIVFYRLIFHGSLPERLMPTLFILIAPPAVGCVSYIKLTGGVDAFAQILYSTGLFFVLLLAFQLRWFTRLKFYLSWWAYSFPLAAIAIASLSMFEHSGSRLHLQLAGLLLGIATVVIAGLVLRTAQAVWRKEICVEE